MMLLCSNPTANKKVLTRGQKAGFCSTEVAKLGRKMRGELKRSISLQAPPLVTSRKIFGFVCWEC